MAHQATLYRMVTPDHVCPFGLKARDLLLRRGYQLDDRHLGSREQTDRFLAEHGVDTTPQIFIDGERIGGYDNLRRYVGQNVPAHEHTSYTPVLAIFATTLLATLAWQWGDGNPLLATQTLARFIALSMCVLAIMKLRDLESFTNQFLGYDLLAQRVVRYAYVYPFAEAFAGIGMLSGVMPLLVALVALFIGTMGAVSVIKAVYVDRRELRCACVGGDSNVPLGFVSLTENLMMVAMGLWLLGGIVLH